MNSLLLNGICCKGAKIASYHYVFNPSFCLINYLSGSHHFGGSIGSSKANCILAVLCQSMLLSYSKMIPGCAQQQQCTKFVQSSNDFILSHLSNYEQNYFFFIS